MADIGTASVGTTTNPLTEPGLRSDIEAAADGFDDFHALWEELITSMDERRDESDPDNRLTPENIMRAYAISFTFPDAVDVSRQTFGETRDLDDHVRTHFETLLDERDVLRRSLGWSADELLDACVLVYIDDAVYRFVTETRFDPTDDDRRTAHFHRYPDELSGELARWMENVDILLESVTGDREIDRTTDRFDELDGFTAEFIRKTTERDVFLPISTGRIIDHADTRDNIKRRIRRGSSSERQIHEYCYNVVESMA